MKSAKIMVLLLLVLAGCSQLDPYTREGVWRPNGANDANLAAMVVNPADLRRGHGDPGDHPVLATDAVDRLLAGSPKPLPALDADASPASGASGGGSGGAAAAPAAAPASAAAN